MKQGEQKGIPATKPGTKQKFHIFGGYDWERDQVTWTMAETKNSETFIIFLEELLLRRYPDEPVILVMDNVSYHKSAAVMAFLSLFEHRVRIVWLPPYCSHLNLIERYWRHLKDIVAANRLAESLEVLRSTAEMTLVRQNQPDSESRFHLSKNFQ
jgi:putative transposase